jgi:phosphoglycolate phosphatase
MIKLIVLDWDDCIISGSSAAYYACYEAAVLENSIEIDHESVERQVRAFWGRPHQDVIASIVDPSNPKLEQVIASYERLILTDLFSQNLQLIEGAKETLLLLKNKYTLAIATGTMGQLLREQLIPRFGLQNIFSSIISSSELSDTDKGKPYPDMLFKLLKEIGIPPEDAIMVGDAQGDVRMAQAAGVLPVVVLTGQLNREEAVALGIKHIIQSIADLPLLLSKIES